jgi:hypothetical protein
VFSVSRSEHAMISRRISARLALDVGEAIEVRAIEQALVHAAFRSW